MRSSVRFGHAASSLSTSSSSTEGRIVMSRSGEGLRQVAKVRWSSWTRLSSRLVTVWGTLSKILAKECTSMSGGGSSVYSIVSSARRGIDTPEKKLARIRGVALRDAFLRDCNRAMGAGSAGSQSRLAERHSNEVMHPSSTR
ncbi:hypothetical protein BV20DRAFT_627118 [Pilatotrama ljubarskyi]|nr:hypothetical protein BV20DRAFT_627118 [Pilatotrama ljubarskyi]